MADHLKNRGPADRTRINVNEPWEVRWWSGKWSITEAQLRAAIAAVGPMVNNVARHLGKSV
jgi:hypothetical protein